MPTGVKLFLANLVGCLGWSYVCGRFAFPEMFLWVGMVVIMIASIIYWASVEKANQRAIEAFESEMANEEK